MRQATFPTLETDVYSLHQQIEKLMGGRSENPYIWSAEKIGSRMIAVTIRSHNLPAALAPSAQDLPSDFKSGDERGFSLVAQCAVRRGPKNVRTAIEPGNDAKRFEWLQRRASPNGFELVSAEIASIERLHIGKMGARHVADRTRFEGVLRVTDPLKLIAALQNGIGHGKAFGLGLLNIE